MLLRRITIITSMLLLMVSFQNCSKSKGGDSGGISASSNVLADKAMAVFNRNCVSCHNATTMSGGLNINDINYMLYYRLIVPGEPQLSILYNRIQDGSMPPTGPLSANDAQAISDWIQSGLTSTSTTPPPPPPQLMATYSSISSLIIKPECTGCHGGAAPSGGIDLTTYMGVMKEVTAGNMNTSVLYTDVSNGIMPKGGAMLSANQISIIGQWIAAGAKNN